MKAEVSEIEKKGRELWNRARSFEELCELMAQFLEGKVLFSPAYAGHIIEAETVPIVPYLAGLNRSGLMTIIAQPGSEAAPHFGGWICKQRAFVEGFALEVTARRMEMLSLASDLFIAVFPPGQGGGVRIPVTACGSPVPPTNAGSSHFEAVQYFDGICHQQAIESLRSAWYVSAIDLHWGRTNHLWEVLKEGIVASIPPVA